MMRKIITLTVLVILLSATSCSAWLEGAPEGQPDEGAMEARQVDEMPPGEGDADTVEILESTAERLVLRYTNPEMRLDSVEEEDGNTYTVVSVPGSGFSAAGVPALPVFGYWILIPNGTEVELEVDPGEQQVYEDILVRPEAAPVADLDESPLPPFAKEEEIYAADADYPSVLAELEETKTLRGQELTILRLYPYQHNPAQRVLTVHTNLTVTVWFHGEPRPIPPQLISEPFDKMMRGMALNADPVLGAEYEAAAHEQAQFGPYGWNYIILTHPNFAQAANKLAAWKKKSGYKVLVEQVPSGVTAAQIQGGLQNAYNTWGLAPEFVLLLGDAEFIPTHYGIWHTYNSTPYKGQKNTQGHSGTDLYYATVQGNDLLPDLYLGRLSVDTAAQAMDRVDDIINYEKNPPQDASFYGTIAMGAEFQDGGDFDFDMGNGTITTKNYKANGTEDRRFTQTTEDIAIFLTGSKVKKSVDRLYYADSANKPDHWYDDNEPPFTWKSFDGPNTSIGGAIPNYLLRKGGFPWNGSASQVTNAVQSGRFLVTQRGHGGTQHWKFPHYTATDVSNLQNDGRLPVVWSINCQTGWFDNETDFKKKAGLPDLSANNLVSFSESWERLAKGPSGDRGAVGVVAATRVSYGRYNARLMMGMVDTIWPDYIKGGGVPGFGAEYRMGYVLNSAKAYMQLNSPKHTDQDITLEVYHWFGDPSMEIRTQKPPLMAVLPETPWPWALRPHYLGLRVELVDDDGQYSGPVEKAKVTITKADKPSEHFVAYTDGEGLATFPETTLNDIGEYDLVVTAPNSVPYEGAFESQPGPAGGVVFDRGVYSCPAEVGVKLADQHLEGAGEVEVLVLSESGDEESLILMEDLPGFFVASLPANPMDPQPQDGLLQVQDGTPIIVHYYDEDDGSGNPAEVEALALIECGAPVEEGFPWP